MRLNINKARFHKSVRIKEYPDMNGNTPRVSVCAEGSSVRPYKPSLLFYEPMTQAILVINRRNPKLRYLVRVEDWVNDCLSVIDAQIPYIGDTAVIVKDNYMVGGTVDESAEVNLFRKEVKNVWV